MSRTSPGSRPNGNVFLPFRGTSRPHRSSGHRPPCGTGFGQVIGSSLLSVARSSETLCFLPLVVRPISVLGCPLRLMSPVADSYKTHGDVLSSEFDEATVRTLPAGLYALPKRWDVFRMSNVPETHALACHFISAVPRRPLGTLMRDAYVSYSLEPPNTVEDYLAARSAKFRNHLKRVERKLASEATASVKEVAATEDVDGAYQMLLEVERGSWKHQHGTAITAVPHQVGFYRDLCHGAAARGRLHFQLLSLRDRPVVYNLGYVRDSTYFYLKTSFVEPWKSLGVVTHLRACLIRSLIDRRLRFIDFPAEPYEWKRQWTETLRWHRRLDLFRGTPAGLTLSLAERVRIASGGRRTVDHVDPRTGDPR